METKDTGRSRIDTFDSYPEFIQTCMKYPANPGKSRNTDIRKWSGTETYEEACDLALKGWNEGAQKAYDLSHDIETRLYSLIERQVISYDITGELLDVARFCDGTPEHWGVFETQLVEGPGTKYFHLVVNGTVSGGISTKVVIERGASIAALVHLAELAGHRVKATLVFSIEGRSVHYEVRVPLKDYEEHLDIDKLAYAIAHPSVLRRHLLSLMEELPEPYYSNFNVGSGYGLPKDTDGARGDIYIEHMLAGDDRWASPESATAWVREELTRLGVIK